jgi:hypothetical protein
MPFWAAYAYSKHAVAMVTDFQHKSSTLAVFILDDGFNVWDDLTVWDVKVV